MRVEIHKNSGFCFGVTQAISKIEELLQSNNELLCLGEIVHNSEEVNRLSQLGMHTITTNDIESTKNSTVLIRSHGEPPSTYTILKENNNNVIDATCPTVLKLQNRIKKSYLNQQKENGQLVIFGKSNHPEVIGLNGQTQNNAIIVHTLEELDKIDFNRPIELYSQTTMSLNEFNIISEEIKKRAKSEIIINDTICRQVANRVPQLKEFSAQHDAIIFVSGKKSSNGKFLFGICKQQNPNTYFISSPEELLFEWIDGKENIGICGATSTPQWLMENVKQHILKHKK